MMSASRGIRNAGGDRRAFTFAELAVVVGTLSVLASVLLPTAVDARSKVHQARCAVNMKHIGVAWGMFGDDHEGWLLPAMLPPPDKLPESFPTHFPQKARTAGVWWRKLVTLGYLAEEAGGPDGVFRCPADAEPVVANCAGKRVHLSYGYMDCFGYPYGTNARHWPTNGGYGVKRREQIKKRPGATVILAEMGDVPNKNANMIVPLGGYGIRPLTNWTLFRHDGGMNLLFEDGRVTFAREADAVTLSTARDFF